MTNLPVTPMKISNYLFIKSLEIAEGWKEASIDRSGIGAALNRVFVPANCPDVRMEIFYRGFPLEQKDSDAFRKVLARTPSVIFEKNENEPAGESAVKLLSDLKEALGNTGNNQVVNSRTDYSGPSFMIERLDVLNWKGKKVLAARGWFRDPEEDVRAGNFCGLFIDANPDYPSCDIEEIFLEAPNQELFLRYLPVFENCLASLEWQT